MSDGDMSDADMTKAGAPIEIAGLWRHPVKSMIGEPVESLHLDRLRPRGDRLWALHDVERDITVTARRLPVVLTLRARYLREPGPESGPGDVPPVLITLPDGTEIPSDDPSVHDSISTVLDREVRLTPLPADPRAHRLSWRERLASARELTTDLGIGADERLPRLSEMDPRTLFTLTRNATPPGSFYDLCPVHLITDASLETIGAALDDAAPDARRFRPNILLAGAPTGLPEASWTDSTVALGDSARLHVVMKTVRCVVPSRAQDELGVDKRITPTVARAADRYLGAYADVTAPGRISVGDRVVITPPRQPGRLATLGRIARTAALDTLNRIAEIGRPRRT